MIGKFSEKKTTKICILKINGKGRKNKSEKIIKYIYIDSMWNDVKSPETVDRHYHISH